MRLSPEGAAAFQPSVTVTLVVSPCFTAFADCDVAEKRPAGVGHHAPASVVSVWGWTGVAVGLALVLYVTFVLVLLMLGRKTDARAWAGFVPDCAILFARLMKDPRVPRRHKLLLAALVAYLSMPFDLVPDFLERGESFVLVFVYF